MQSLLLWCTGHIQTLSLLLSSLLLVIQNVFPFLNIFFYYSLLSFDALLSFWPRGYWLIASRVALSGPSLTPVTDRVGCEVGTGAGAHTLSSLLPCHAFCRMVLLLFGFVSVNGKSKWVNATLSFSYQLGKEELRTPQLTDPLPYEVNFAFRSPN